MILDILEFFFEAFVGFWEGVAGILRTSKNPQVQKLQRFCRVTLAIGLAFILVASSVSYAGRNLDHYWYTVVLFAIGMMLFIVSGSLGSRINKSCDEQKQPVDDEDTARS